MICCDMSKVNVQKLFRRMLQSIFFSMQSVSICISILIILILYAYVQNASIQASSRIFALLNTSTSRSEIFALAYRFLIIAAGSTAIYYTSLFLKKYITLYWKQTITQQLVNCWISSKHFTHHNIENIDKRLTDDIKSISITLGELLHGATTALIQLCIYTPKFINEIQKCGNGIGKIAIIVILLALLFSMLNLIFKHYIQYYHEQFLETEGALRRTIKGTDQMSSAIAMFNGKEATFTHIKQTVHMNINAQRKIMIIKTLSGFVQSIVNTMNSNMGRLLFTPLACAGLATTYDTVYAASLLWYILYNLVFITQNTDKFSEISVSMKRLNEIYDTCMNVSATGLIQAKSLDSNIHINATIFVPTDNTMKMILHNVNLHIAPREHILIYGKSGTGKTTLLSALHGHYTTASGTISTPATTKLFFLPHKTLVIEGDIFANVAYPCDHCDKQQIEYILSKILPLYKTLNMQNLSAGERQKIQLARLLYQSDDKYNAIFLDEPFSNIDNHESQVLMKMICESLPNSSIIICMHNGQEILGDIFDKQINLEKYALRE